MVCWYPFAALMHIENNFPRASLMQRKELCSERDLANLKSYIALLQQEERSIQELIYNPSTSPAMRTRANDRRAVVHKELRESTDELTKLEASE
jgi:hypothetical protein